jgi:type II secretory pathway pseudopilin PulG
VSKEESVMKGNPNQQGIAMLILVFMIALALTGYLVSGLNSESYKRNREKQTARVLEQAKEALIGWSVAHPQYPGIMPFPDRSNFDFNYDGNSDCVAALNFSHLIGRLPFATQTAPCVGTGAAEYGLSDNFIDGDGEGLWYAVSRNLIRPTALGAVVINPAIMNTPTFPWLIVRDKNGQVISNRVAAVIMSPGKVVGAQNRAGGIAGPVAYLDTAVVNGVAYSNANYALPNEDFIMGEDMQFVSNPHPVYGQPYQFNDKLIYITIDELMLALERRAIREARNALLNYYSASAPAVADRFYPYAAQLGDVSHACTETTLAGGLPIDSPLATCTHPNVGLNVFLPAWFIESRWQDFMYYVISPDCSFATPGCLAGGNITVGAQANVNALLVSTGAALVGQNRPSNNLVDYVDSIENSNGDNVFDAVGTALSNIYNDQMLVVAP